MLNERHWRSAPLNPSMELPVSAPLQSVLNECHRHSAPLCIPCTKGSALCTPAGQNVISDAVPSVGISSRPVFQKSSNRVFSKNKSRHFVTFWGKSPIASALIFDLIGHIQFFFTSSLSINEQNKRHQLFTVDALWVTHYSLFTKLKLNKIAARWPAKAVAQFSTFSKIGSDRIVPR